MNKFGRNKVALFLTCMSVLGNKISAVNTNKSQSPQTVAAVGGATSRSNQSVKQGLTKNQKLAIGAIASLVGITAIGLTIWGVKKHLDNKNKGNEGKNKQDKENIENTTSGKRDDDKGGCDYVSEVNKRLSLSNKNSMMETFNKAVNMIKNNKFSDKDTKEFAEFLKVVKGEKKVLEKGMFGAFTFSNNEIFVDLDDRMTYGLYFGINHFEIQKIDGTQVVYSLKLSYD